MTSDAKNFYTVSSDPALQNNQEISYTIANSGKEDEAEAGTPETPTDQRSRWCPLFYLLILPGYTVLGAVLFRFCENTVSNQLIDAYRDRCIMEREMTLGDLRRRFDVSMAENATLVAPNLSFEDISDALMVVDRCLRNKSGLKPEAFDFVSSGVYTVSVLTTVGYGDLVPRTPQGRIATMLYASIGIPLYIAFNADFGEWISGRMVWAYTKLRRFYISVIKRRSPSIEERLRPISEMTKFLIVLLVAVVFLFLHACSTLHLENATGKNSWTYMDSVYFLFTTVTLVGFGDLTIDNDYIFVFVQVPILLFGQAIVALYYYYIQNAIRYKIPAMVEGWYHKKFGVKKQKASQVSTGVEERDDGSREHRRRSRRRFRKLRKALLGRKDTTESSSILLPPSEPLAVQQQQQQQKTPVKNTN